MLPILTALLFSVFGVSTDSRLPPVNADAYDPVVTSQTSSFQRVANDFAASVAGFAQRDNGDQAAENPSRNDAEIRSEKKFGLQQFADTRLAIRQTEEGDAADDTIDSESPPAKAESSDANRPSEKTPSAVSLLRQSRKDLNSLSSMRAQLDETISFGPKRFKAAGLYLQGDRLRLKLEYHLKLGESEGTLLEVCDGQLLWTEQTIDNSVQVTRRDVKQILETANSLMPSRSTALHTELGLGGLPALLASLENTMTFTVGDSKTVDGREVTILEGRWNKEYFSLWSNNSDDPDVMLPAYVPDRVRIYMEHISHKNRTVLFPTRIIYLKKTDPEKSKYRPIVRLEFAKIVLDGPVDEDEFVYTPKEGITPVDLTQEYIQQLKPPSSRAPAGSAAGK